MSMADMIDERLVSFGLDVTNKEDAIRKICKMMYDAGKVSSYEDYLQGVKDRELEFETGMGNGIAIPHCKGGCVKESGLLRFRCVLLLYSQSMQKLHGMEHLKMKFL